MCASKKCLRNVLTHTETQTQTHTLFQPLSTLEALLSMHQFRHLRGQSFMCEAFPWFLSLLLHQPLHLRQRQEGEQLQVPVKRPHNIPQPPATAKRIPTLASESIQGPSFFETLYCAVYFNFKWIKLSLWSFDCRLLGKNVKAITCF